MSMVIGTIISNDEYDLSLDDTLGEIFVDENDWSGMEDQDEVAFKQNITIFELLTMTSGLIESHLYTLVSSISLNPLTGAIDLAHSAGPCSTCKRDWLRPTSDFFPKRSSKNLSPSRPGIICSAGMIRTGYFGLLWLSIKPSSPPQLDRVFGAEVASWGKPFVSITRRNGLLRTSEATPFGTSEIGIC